MHTTTARYIAPTRSDRRFNAVVGWFTRRGLPVAGSRVLAIRGRTSGEVRTTVVNLLTVEGDSYLVAPRGTTQWVRNLRASRSGELRRGHRASTFTAVELDDADKLPILREYLRRWGWEVGKFFEGVTKDATDDDLARIAPGFPVFRVRLD